MSAISNNLDRAQAKLEEAGKLAGKLLVDDQLDPELVPLVHDLISEQALALNSVRFARRGLSTEGEN